MAKAKKVRRDEEQGVDTVSNKRGRGRPRRCRYSEIWGRAQNYHGIFAEVWKKLSGPLLAARTEDEVTEVFRSHAESYAQEFVPRLARDILNVIREKKFPKKHGTQISFIANSLAGRPNVEPRTSRDICARALAEEEARSPHKILRKEFYVECSCGYRGPALNNACRMCGAQINMLAELLQGSLNQFWS